MRLFTCYTYYIAEHGVAAQKNVVTMCFLPWILQAATTCYIFDSHRCFQVKQLIH